MENTKFAPLSVNDFSLNFGSHKVEVIFDANNKKWHAETTGWTSVSYGNSLVNLMLGSYAYQPEPRVFMRKSFDEIKFLPESDDLGYIMGDMVKKYAAAGLLSYKRLDEVIDTDMYRVAWDGWNVVYVRHVDWKDYDENEAEYVKHSRNAWTLVGNLSRMRNMRDMGINFRLVYTDKELPYFTQALKFRVDDDGVVTEGEGGLQAKYQLYNEGRIDDLRKLINFQIANRNVQKGLYRAAKKEIKAREAAQVEGAEYKNPNAVKNAEWAPLHWITGKPVTKDELVGKTIQLVVNGGTRLPIMWQVVANDQTFDVSKRIVTVDMMWKQIKSFSAKVSFLGEKSAK